ncbi:MAG: Solitary outer membrane autotransporter beta-barrel domain [Colwellia sp.]|nr:Solitary outer membrane autotransporter beta-barrel domain [Colwellia sp.]
MSYRLHYPIYLATVGNQADRKQAKFFYKDEITTSISYLKQETKSDLLSQSTLTDDNKDEIYSAFNGSESSQGARPGGWRLNNALKLHYNLNQSRFHAESLYVKFQRSDIGGDMVNSLGTEHFYEFGVGILLDTRKFTKLADNVGIGINIHKGSALSGGSIVFYFNEL